MKYRVLRSLTGILFLILFPGSSAAQIDLVDSVLTLTASDGVRTQSSGVAYGPDGGFGVVWSESNAGGPDVLLRRFDPDGNPMGDPLPVATQGYNLEPGIAFDGAGNFVVTWTRGEAIFAQRFDSTGALLGDPLTVYEPGPNQRSSPPLVKRSGDGTFVILWTIIDRNGSTKNHVNARRFAADGSPLSDAFRVSASLGNSESFPSLDMRVDGSFIAGWHDAGQSNFFARRFAPDGTAIDTEDLLLFTSPASRITGFHLAYDGAGGFAAARVRSFGFYYVEGRRFAADGTPTTEEFIVDTTYVITPVFVDFDPAGHLVFSWGGWDFSVGGQVVARQVDAEGTPISNSFAFPFSTMTYVRYLAGAMGPKGNFLHVWSHVSGGIHAQQFHSVNPALVGHWPLDEGNGIDTANSAGDGLLDGILEDGAGWTLAQQNQGVVFDGEDDLIRILDPGTSKIDVTDGLTLALWVRPERLDSASTQILVSKDNAYELDINRLGAGQVSLRLNNETAISSSNPLHEGVWQHVAVTWDGSTARFYRDGQLEGSQAYANILIPNDEDLGFGARPSLLGSGGPVFFFEGALDEVYLFNSALEPEQIEEMVTDSITDTQPPLRSNFSPASNLPTGTLVANLSTSTDEAAECRYDTAPGIAFRDMAGTFTNTGGTTHSTQVPVQDDQLFFFTVRCRDVLGNTNGDDEFITFGVGGTDRCVGRVGAWGFDEGSGCAVGEEGGGTSGALGPECPNDAPTWTAGHHGGTGALRFDGGNHKVEVNSSSFGSLGQVTLSAWVRSGGSGYRSLIDLRDSHLDGYDLYLTPDSKPLLRVNQHTLVGEVALAANQWHHLVGTYDGTTLRLFVNGLSDSSRVIGSTVIDVTQPLKFGHHFSTTSNYSLSGDLSQVEIWDRALSSVDVLEHFLMDGVLSCPAGP